jgi:hypothetical protein
VGLPTRWCCKHVRRELDNEPLLGTALHVGDELAVGYGKVVEHRKASDFKKQ